MVDYLTTYLYADTFRWQQHRQPQRQTLHDTKYIRWHQRHCRRAFFSLSRFLTVCPLVLLSLLCTLSLYRYYTHTHTQRERHTHVHTRTQMHTHTHILIHTHTNIHIHPHTHTTHTHTHDRDLPQSWATKISKTKSPGFDVLSVLCVCVEVDGRELVVVYLQ